MIIIIARDVCLCCWCRGLLSQIMRLKVILMVFLLSVVKLAVLIIRYGACCTVKWFRFILSYCFLLSVPVHLIARKDLPITVKS